MLTALGSNNRRENDNSLCLVPLLSGQRIRLGGSVYLEKERVDWQLAKQMNIGSMMVVPAAENRTPSKIALWTYLTFLGRVYFWCTVDTDVKVKC